MSCAALLRERRPTGSSSRSTPWRRCNGPERPAEAGKDGFVRYERRFGTFSRALGVPAGVIEEGIEADYKDGVLEIRVAKPEAPKPRRIKLGGGHATI